MTIVVCHRTAQRFARENSLEGIARAAELDAAFVELDARRARDGTPVLLHDPWLGRVEHVPLLLKWAPQSLLVRLRVPTLADALEVAREHKIKVAIDTKDPGAAPAVIETVNAAGMVEEILPWSQHMPAVRAYIRAWPDAEVALLRETHDEESHARFFRDAEAIGARAVSCNQDAVTPDFIAKAKEHGLLVYVWYQQLAKQNEKLAEVAAAGLHGVVTDWPTEALATLARS